MMNKYQSSLCKRTPHRCDSACVTLFILQPKLRKQFLYKDMIGYPLQEVLILSKNNLFDVQMFVRLGLWAAKYKNVQADEALAQQCSNH